MTNPFAAIETSVNAALMGALANVTATVGGVSVTGIFDAAYQDALGITGSAPALLCASADVAAAVEGTAVVVGSTSYTVTTAEPDGTGLTRLRLQEV